MRGTAVKVTVIYKTTVRMPMRFLCEEDSSTHLLLWHYAPVLFLAVIGIFLGKTLVKWKYPTFKENKK